MLIAYDVKVANPLTLYLGHNHNYHTLGKWVTANNDRLKGVNSPRCRAPVYYRTVDINISLEMPIFFGVCASTQYVNPPLPPMADAAVGPTWRGVAVASMEGQWKDRWKTADMGAVRCL